MNALKIEWPKEPFQSNLAKQFKLWHMIARERLLIAEPGYDIKEHLYETIEEKYND